MKNKRIGLIAIISFVSALGFAQQTPKTDATKSINEVVPPDEVVWGYLNPLRGDQSPAAGKLWGDRTKNEASGFLVKFKKGFSSPPHIHNITYRGIVLQGALHNDDPTAAELWLPKGSFWIQPAGEAHITAANAEENLAYIEIQSGPYLVQPTTEAFDNGERPINVDPSNLVWTKASEISWINPSSASKSAGLETAFLWGSHQEGELRGTLIKFPPNYKAVFHNLSPNFRAVLIQGQVKQQFIGQSESHQLLPSSYFGAATNTRIELETGDEAGAIIYIRSNGNYTLN